MALDIILRSGKKTTRMNKAKNLIIDINLRKLVNFKDRMIK